MIKTIENPVDKFAELKEAYRNGSVIEYRHASLPNASWKINNNPAWNDNYEYRIKPEEPQSSEGLYEPNIGKDGNND